MLDKKTVFIRGAGELASACAVVLHRVGFQIYMSELDNPLAIRRNLTFSDAMYENRTTVEDVEGVYCASVNKIGSEKDGIVLVFKDNINTITETKPNILIDARMLKREVPSRLNIAEFVVGLGPGFEVEKNCHVIIETKRGHDLGRILYSGTAAKNTGTPGKLGGESKKRVIYAVNSGNVKWDVDFGQIVEEGQKIGIINTYDILAPLNGMVRGKISEHVNIQTGLKIGDIDPRGLEVNYRTISDKASAIARACLEAILVEYRK